MLTLLLRSACLRKHECVEVAVLFSAAALASDTSALTHFSQPQHLQLSLPQNFNPLSWCRFPQLPSQHHRHICSMGYLYENLQRDLKISSVPSYGREGGNTIIVKTVPLAGGVRAVSCITICTVPQRVKSLFGFSNVIMVLAPQLEGLKLPWS